MKTMSEQFAQISLASTRRGTFHS